MCRLKKKIILLIILFVAMLNITKCVQASDLEITITKETDELIEGTIESKIEAKDVFAESSINTTSQNIDPNTFYYSQLKNEMSRKIYNELKKDTTGIGKTVVKLTNQTYSIDTTRFYKDEAYSDNIMNTQIFGYIDDAIVAFEDDNPKLYWYYDSDVTVKYNVDKTKKTITYNSAIFESKINERSNYNKFNQKLKEVVDSIDGTSTYEIVKKCHDYICNTVVYTDKENTDIDQTAYDALINKQGVCDAQSRLFQLLCIEKKIKCISVSGKSVNKNNEQGNHSWNYIYHPDEKKWYAIDTTWDNNKKYGNGPTYNYFLVGKNTPIKYGSRTVNFSENHIPGFKNYSIQTYFPQVPDLSDEAYKKFGGMIQKSTYNKTNQPVTVTLTFSRELKEYPNGWNISADKKILNKTFDSNINESHTVKNVRGERLNVNIDIDNIDKVAPQAKISYSSKDKTNENVKVTITANEELQSIRGWKLSQDKKTLTKTFISNIREDISIKDLAGNIKSIPIEINNIDKLNPVLTITYNLTELNENKVYVSVKGNEELQEIEGWNISEDKTTLTKTYTNNSSEEILIKDLAGNSSTKNIAVNVINNVNEKYITHYILKEDDEGKVQATIIANKELKPIEGWTLNEEKNSLNKVYVEKATEEVEVEDLEGNKSNLIINSNVNVRHFLTSVLYSNDEKTNDDVEVTIYSNMGLIQKEGWTLSEDGKSLTKIYSNNIKENVTVYNGFSEKREEIIEINNIDKEPPQLLIQYSDVNDNGEIMVSIISNEELSEKENWTLSEDKKSITRIYNNPIEDYISVKDIVGNEEKIQIQITEFQLSPIVKDNKTSERENISKIAGIEEYNLNNNEEKIDSVIEVENTSSHTTVIKQPKQQTKESPKMTLPYTGNGIIIVYILLTIFIILGIISYIRYIRYRDVN